MDRYQGFMEKIKIFLAEMQENRDNEMLEAEKVKNSTDIGRNEAYLAHMAAVISLSCAIGELKMILTEEESK